MYELREIGCSSAVGIGGDPVVGTTHTDSLAPFENDPDTELVVLIGEIGGDAEERAAVYVAEHVTKPFAGRIAGFTTPRAGRRATPERSSRAPGGTAEAEQRAPKRRASVPVRRRPGPHALCTRALRSPQAENSHSFSGSCE
ncbi:hypothetical protein ABZ208_03535 [Streptomyces sp. NPDC006208]|uniref:hypothetical protein n=1 Tax=Streptomyces sp. NPDC006208 TaxID=3156734 RepID=UPI0033B01C01